MDKGKAVELLQVTFLNFGGKYLELRLHNKFERELTCRSLIHYSPTTAHFVAEGKWE